MLYISELRHIKIDIFYDIYKYFLVEHKILFGFATIKKKWNLNILIDQECIDLL